MDLKNYLDDTPYPWNCTDTNFLKDFFYQKNNLNLQVFVKQLDEMIAIDANLQVDYEVDYIPEDILEYPMFLWGSLKNEMPTYQEINDKGIEHILKLQGIKHPSSIQIIWTYHNWIKMLVVSKIDLLMIFLTDYFKNHPDDIFLPLAVETVKKYIFSPYIKKSAPLINFLVSVAPYEAKTVLEKIIETTQDHKEWALDYLKLVQ